MNLYPLFLDLSRKAVLIAGCGPVGLRKARSLAACKPRVIEIVDPLPPPAGELEKLTAKANVVLKTRPFNNSDLEDKFLVFAATGNQAVNIEIARLCREKDILCNLADAPAASDFFTPAHFYSDGLTVAVSTGGQSPALAARIKREIEEWLTGRYTGLIPIMGRLRPLLLALGLDAETNTRIFQAVAESDEISKAAKANDITALHAALKGIVPDELYSGLRKITGEDADDF